MYVHDFGCNEKPFLFSSNLSWIRLSYIEPLIGFDSLQIPGIGLPDGLFSKNPNLGIFWRVLQRNMLLCIFYDHLDYFTVIWYNLWPFGIVCGLLVFFPRLVCLDQEKSGNPADAETQLTFQAATNSSDN
jgi:hypothetical protein